MPLALAGKQAIANSMYNKGKAFVGAAILLSREGSSEHTHYVALHNFCQGTEIVLKGLLLYRDYDKYKPRLRLLGHNLVAIAREAASAYGRREPRANLATELATLNGFYSKHLLRYGGLIDIFIDPRTIPRKKTFRYMVALIRAAERFVNNQQHPDAVGRAG